MFSHFFGNLSSEEEDDSELSDEVEFPAAGDAAGATNTSTRRTDQHDAHGLLIIITRGEERKLQSVVKSPGAS